MRLRLDSLRFYPLAALAAIFALTGSKCESTTDFPPYAKELCTDKIDNDQDSLVDCKDPDCAAACMLVVTLNSLPDTVSTTTLALSGTQANAQSITLSISTSGSAGPATLDGSAWSATLSQLQGEGKYTVTLIAKGFNDSSQTLTQSFERKN